MAETKNSNSSFDTTNPEPLMSKIWDPRTARALCTLLIFLLVLGFLYTARETLTLFLFAILFAYFLAPLVKLLERRLRGRGRAVAAVYVALAILFTVLGLIFGPNITTQAKQLVSSLPSLADRIGSGQLIMEFGREHHWAPERIKQLQQFLMAHRVQIIGYATDVAERVAKPIQHAWWLILIPILSLFFLLEGEDLAGSLVNLGRSRSQRNVLNGLMYDVNIMLGSYIRAQLVLAALTAVSYTVVLSLMRVPYALILAVASGFLEFIPVVGPAIGAAAVVIIAVLAGYTHAVWLVFYLGCWRIMQDYLNAPRIMGKSLEINPLTQIFAVLAGGEIGGVVGALVSVPAAAILRMLWRRLQDVRDYEAMEAARTPDSPPPCTTAG